MCIRCRLREALETAKSERENEYRNVRARLERFPTEFIIEVAKLIQEQLPERLHVSIKTRDEGLTMLADHVLAGKTAIKAIKVTREEMADLMEDIGAFAPVGFEPVDPKQAN